MNDQVTQLETDEILRLAERAFFQNGEGDFVELGCYRGDTSVLLGKLLQNLQSASIVPPRHLWIYDSFAGLPEKTREDASGAGANFQAGELFVTKREVVAKIRRHNLKNIIIKKAWFDELTDADLPKKIAFAFCDGDLYSSIRTSLRLVWPRLTKQGIVIVHDYNNAELPGSARAVDEFLKSHPEVQLRVWQTLAILSRKA